MVISRWPQGQETSQSLVSCRLLTGKELDPDSVAFSSANSRYNVYLRVYQAYRGLFASIDPLSFLFASARYTYGGSNPTSFVDPDGMEDCLAKPKLTGELIRPHIEGFKDWPGNPEDEPAEAPDTPTSGKGKGERRDVPTIRGERGCPPAPRPPRPIGTSGAPKAPKLLPIIELIDFGQRIWIGFTAEKRTLYDEDAKRLSSKRAADHCTPPHEEYPCGIGTQCVGVVKNLKRTENVGRGPGGGPELSRPNQSAPGTFPIWVEYQFDVECQCERTAWDRIIGGLADGGDNFLRRIFGAKY